MEENMVDDCLKIGRGRVFHIDHHLIFEPVFVFTNHRSDFEIAGAVETLFHDRHFPGFNDGKIQMQHKKGIMQSCWILADPGMAEKFVEPVPEKDAVIAFHHGAQQRLAKSFGTQEYRIVDLFQLFDIGRFINIIAAFADNSLITGLGVQYALFHFLRISRVFMPRYGLSENSFGIIFQNVYGML
jgi:hypothetical protein